VVTEVYTLQDMMEGYEESPLDDALYQNYKDTSVLAAVYEDRRVIELTVDGSDVVTVDTMQNHTQQVSDIVQQFGDGRVQFIGVEGGTDFRLTLVFKY
jgi:hypothetical protein